MKRRLFNIATVVSLLLFLAVVVLWVRSYWVADDLESEARWHVGTNTHVHEIQLFSTRGGCFLLGGAYSLPWPAQDQPWPAAPRRWRHSTGPPSDFDRDHPWRPLFVQETDGDVVAVSLRYWPLCILLSVFPVLWLVSTCHNPRATTGCPSCGYDLRATPGRCPECGATATMPINTPPADR